MLFIKKNLRKNKTNKNRYKKPILKKEDKNSNHLKINSLLLT